LGPLLQAGGWAQC